MLLVVKNARKVKVLSKHPEPYVGASRPMERIATDLLGELPVTDKGNIYILVVSDYYTKWTARVDRSISDAQYGGKNGSRYYR